MICPPSTFPGGDGISRRIDIAVTDFPQPALADDGDGLAGIDRERHVAHRADLAAFGVERDVEVARPPTTAGMWRAWLLSIVTRCLRNFGSRASRSASPIRLYAKTVRTTLTGWQDTFVAAGEASLATRSADGEALETERLKAKLGEMLLERELLDAKIAALEANRPLARQRSRR